MAEHHEPRDHEDARAVRDVRALFARAWLETVPAMRLLEAPRSIQKLVAGILPRSRRV